MLYGTDWKLGDTVTVVVNNLEATAVVYQVGMSVQSDGVYLAATVGNPTPLQFESRLMATQSEHDSRISNLERNTTGYGVSTLFAVECGTDGDQPVFDGAVFTASYTRFGDLIHFVYKVDFTNITDFGTGQYYMTLPYNPAHFYAFSDAVLKDASSSKVYHLYGVALPSQNQLQLWYTTSNGLGAEFEHNSPITLTSDDSFYISGTYEIEV